jgi:hypothetical protein
MGGNPEALDVPGPWEMTLRDQNLLIYLRLIKNIARPLHFFDYQDAEKVCWTVVVPSLPLTASPVFDWKNEGMKTFIFRTFARLYKTLKHFFSTLLESLNEIP